MEEAATTHPEPFVMLWLLAALVAWLGSHVALGFTREARRQTLAGARLWRLGAAVLALATGVWAASALAVASQPLAYAVGFGADTLASAGGLAVVAAALPVGLMAWRASLASALAGAVWFGLLSCLSQAAMLVATGPEPGLQWRYLPAGVAVLACTAASAWALWTAHLGPGRAGRYRRRWRWAAAVLMAGGLMLGQDLVHVSGDLATQVASAHALDIPMSVLTLATALTAPVLLGVLAGVLHLGRSVGGDDDSTLARPVVMPQRRRRRHRSWWRRLFP